MGKKIWGEKRRGYLVGERRSGQRRDLVRG